MGNAHTLRGSLVLAGAGLLIASCSEGSEPVATVLVDDEHDEFATQFILFLPDEVRAHPGDTISFEQHWTGEPHTVTFGTAVTEVLEITRPLIAEYGDRPDHEVPPEVLEEYFAAESSLPSWYGGPPEEGEDEDPSDDPDAAATNVTADVPDDERDDAATPSFTPPMPQALAQPCLITDGEVPEDTMAPCEEQELPPFEGTETYYNSGIIPYEGPSGNTFEFTLSEDIAPGTYGFYCAVHGSFQSGVVEVVPEDQPIPPREENARQLREAVTAVVEPFEQTFNEALQGRYSYAGEDHDWNYAGLLDEEATDGIVNEFLPAVIEARVDEPVTWRMFGGHSISFDVPEYLPIVEFSEDGQVQSNEAAYAPAGGAPPLPEPGGPGEAGEDGEAGEAGEDGPPEPMVIDGGTWDGDGFWSSGVVYAEPYLDYTVRVSRPGTYRYACLIHPPMVGTLRVTE